MINAIYFNKIYWTVLTATMFLLLILQIESQVFAFAILGYMFFCFFYFAISYVISQIALSKYLKKELPIIYEKYKGFSRIGTTRIVTPFFVFNKTIVGQIKDNDALSKMNKLKTNILFAWLSFLFCIIFSILPAII